MSEIRIKTPNELREWMWQNNIPAHMHENIGKTPSVSASAHVLGVEPEQIVKSILVVLKYENQKPYSFALVIGHGNKNISMEALADHFQLAKRRVRLATPTEVIEELGYPVGGVPPFGFEKAFPVVCDLSLKTWAMRQEMGLKTTIYAGGGDETSLISLTFQDCMEFLCPTWIEL